MDSKTVFRSYNKLYFEMLEFLKNNISKSNTSFSIFYKKNHMLRRANIKLFIKKWYENISIPYHKEILDGNIDYFLNKDFSDDMKNAGSLKSELSMNDNIEYIKRIYQNIDKDLVETLVTYIQNLTKLSILYHNI